MFSYTEQLNRRSTFLASYRLERERILSDQRYGTNFDNLPNEDADRRCTDAAMAFATKQ